MKKNENDPVEPQSQSIPGPTNDNPNEDVEDGNQSTIQPGTGSGDSGGAATGVAQVPPSSVPSTGGNPAAAEGGSSSTAGGQ